jgi:MATE family multidrug resistance protein
MLISEWWAFEFLTLCASKLGTAEVAAQTVMMQTTYLCYMIPYGLSSAGSSLVGNFIGAGKLPVAIRMAKMVIYVDIACQLVVGRIILLCGQYIIESFTNDISIVRIAVLILPILPFSNW